MALAPAGSVSLEGEWAWVDQEGFTGEWGMERRGVVGGAGLKGSHSREGRLQGVGFPH